MLITSSFYVLIATHHYCCYLLEIPAEAKAELQFWCNQLVEFNGQDIYHNPSAISFVFSSPVILATHCWIYDGTQLPCYVRTVAPAGHKTKYNLVEIRVIPNVPVTLTSMLQNQRVCWFTTNQYNRDSRKSEASFQTESVNSLWAVTLFINKN